MSFSEDKFIKHQNIYLKKFFRDSFTDKCSGQLILVTGIMNRDKNKKILQTNSLPVIEKHFQSGVTIFSNTLPGVTLQKNFLYFKTIGLTILLWR